MVILYLTISVWFHASWGNYLSAPRLPYYTPLQQVFCQVQPKEANGERWEGGGKEQLFISFYWTTVLQHAAGVDDG